ncbi:hypothetical protein OESDEN_03305 [Oesophagostomum dentatum]|uniref:Uncharacterized protein n=1 Tax=Oesophagostomum dentatum TaxID=61180 RepID=A0A0B1THL3_OESDE|nr:hypothetical protein OESDEN_03305 [Oesophagostomum dentatum]
MSFKKVSDVKCSVPAAAVLYKKHSGKPHSTSKLTGLNDFGTLSTLGFRGEALNALCSLASLTILTKSRTATVGTKLRFDHCGNITDQSSCARSVGTTVTVEKLFETLPVRRKEFEKTSKKEFGRLLNVVQCFALCRPDVKFICSNIVEGTRPRRTSDKTLEKKPADSSKDMINNKY